MMDIVIKDINYLKEISKSIAIITKDDTEAEEVYNMISKNEIEDAKKAFDALKSLKGSEAHATVILSQVDRDTFRKLGINLTCEPVYATRRLYHK